MTSERVRTSQKPPVSQARLLRRRLAPVYVAVFLHNVALWVPIEKLFMTGIGFDAATIGVMAGVYACVVPLLEIPSGILADRWSRRGVLLLALVALGISVSVGGLSPNVAVYLVAALFLGVFFAMQSGTIDSMVYDTVLEETGDSTVFEKAVGRLRLVESVALVASALAGGLLAEALPLRWTYFLTVPFIVCAAVAILLFREPQLHKAELAEPLGRQIKLTFRTISGRGALRTLVALIIPTTLLTQAMMEFGPLWLVALAVPAFVYGPHWAGLTAALGLGGLIGSHPKLTRRWTLVLIAVALAAASVLLALNISAAVVIAAQVVVVLLLVTVSIPTMRRMHDSVTSSVRAGVASGVSTLSWTAFLPFSLAFGAVADRSGVHTAAWLLVAIAVAAACLIPLVLRDAPTKPPAAAPPAVNVGTLAQPPFAPGQFLPDDHPTWPGHWREPPDSWGDLDAEEATEQIRQAIAALPTPHRHVIVARDIQRRSPGEVGRELGLTPEAELDLLHQARSHLRAHLERYLESR